MADINLSKAVRSNLLSLQNTAAMMGKTQERLATGNKVNSALDNPTNFFTASALNSRASDLGLLMDSVGNAVQTIAAADKGIKAITKLVESAQATARQALQSAATIETATPGTVTSQATKSSTGSNNFNVVSPGNTPGTATSTGADTTLTASAASAGFAAGETLTVAAGTASVTLDFYSLGAGAYTGANEEIDMDGDVQSVLAAMQTKIQGAGGDLATATVSLVDGKITIGLGTNTTDDLTLSGNAAASLNLPTTAQAAGTTPGSNKFGDLATAGKTFTIAMDDGTAQTITFGTGQNEVDTLAKLNTQLATATSNSVSASVDATTGALTLTSTGGKSFTLAGADLTDLGLTAGESDPVRAASTGSSTAANPKRQELLEQFNDLMDQIDQLAKDAGFNGVNLLQGDDLEVLFNEDGSSKLNMVGVDMSATGTNSLLDLDKATNMSSWNTKEGINATLDKLKAGIDTLRTQASKFGSNLSIVENRQTFTKDMINVLQTGAANLTLADTNEEAANLLALQTRQSLSSSTLSMASQADQSVLQLLR